MKYKTRKMYLTDIKSFMYDLCLLFIYENYPKYYNPLTDLFLN